MSKSAVERIREMRDKGMITAEQAEELLKALSGESSDQPEDTEEEPGTTGPEPVNPPPPEENAGQDDSRSRRGRRRSDSFFDMGWVDDMVDGITTGLGVSSDRGSWNAGSGKYAYDYHYEWDPRRERKRSGNAQNSSRVDAPTGEAFEFESNRIVFSKMSGFLLVRSKVKDNSFSASTFRDAELTDSTMRDSSLAGASVNDLRMDKAEMKDVTIAGSKVSRMVLREGSLLKSTRIAGSAVTGLSLEGGSRIEDTRLAGCAGVNGFTLTAGSEIKDCRFNGTGANHVSFRKSSLSDLRFDGCTIGDTTIENAEIKNCSFRGVSLQESGIDASQLKDCRFEAIGFSGLRMQNSELKNVTFRDAFDGRFPRRAEKLSIIDSKLDNVQFIGCIFQDTTIKGTRARDVRLRGVDLTGRTIERAEDLIALAER
jgi:uncharacterized protein YjbI with pentapeptide repeats